MRPFGKAEKAPQSAEIPRPVNEEAEKERGHHAEQAVLKLYSLDRTIADAQTKRKDILKLLDELGASDMYKPSDIEGYRQPTQVDVERMRAGKPRTDAERADEF